MPYKLVPSLTLKWCVDWDYEDVVEQNFIGPLRYLDHLTPELLSRAPKQLRCTPVGKEWPDMIFNSFQWVVRPAVKAAIEELEPSVHTFIPVELVSKKHRLPEPFYFLRIGQAVDAVVVAKSDFSQGFGQSAFDKGDVLTLRGKIVLRASQIIGKHLWRGGWAWPDGRADRFVFDYFCSDRLRDRIKAEGFRDCEFTVCEVE
ncbi:MAG: hypothetical protein NW223_03300 [Hyphomicrobiaceae bacterium]|nr:hypothetical protein [Hyphomicrobiaceae bacterium]